MTLAVERFVRDSATGIGADSRPVAGNGVAFWLFAMGWLVFLMVMVGGGTRLTESGLSITEWKPLLGAIPPLTAADWQDAFDKYRQIPQYQQINKGMSLAAFQYIYWWEWGHRFLGRFIGLAFLLPFLYFWAKGRIGTRLMPRLLLMFVLGGLQGFVGWYMVSSGLVERVDVSQYRLALHLGLAAFIFAYILWVALGLEPRRKGPLPSPVPAGLGLSALGIAMLVFLQIVLGAFVAGLDAGQGYNTWPLMDGAFIPEGLTVMSPLWVNLFENAMTVQFDHRMVAYLLAAWIFLHALAARRHRATRLSAVLLLIGVLAQIGLGVWTLLEAVPIELGLLHQAGAFILLALAVIHLSDLTRQPRRAVIPA